MRFYREIWLYAQSGLALAAAPANIYVITILYLRQRNGADVQMSTVARGGKKEIEEAWRHIKVQETIFKQSSFISKKRKISLSGQFF